jgi:hypothetical protein
MTPSRDISRLLDIMAASRAMSLYVPFSKGSLCCGNRPFASSGHIQA